MLTVALSLIATLQLEREARREARAAFDRIAIGHLRDIDLHLRAYADVLYAARGLFDASGTVTREEFRRFAGALALGQRYPGLTNLSFAQLVAAADTAAFEQGVRSEQGPRVQGWPAFAIRPPGEREAYLVLNYIEPMERNVAAWGFDLLSDPKRRQAAERARDSGGIGSVSGVQLVRDSQTPSAPTSTLFRLAVYRGGGVPGDTAARRRLWLGVVGSTLRVSELVEATLDKATLDRVRVEIHAGAAEGGAAGMAATSETLYDSAPRNRADLGEYATERVFDVGDHRWRMRITPRIDPIDEEVRLLLVAALLGMLALSALLFWLMRSLATVQVRSRELARRNREAASLAAFGEDLHSCQALHDACAVLPRRMPELLTGVAGGVLYLGDATSRMRAAVRWGSPQSANDAFAPIDCQALRRGHAIGVAPSRPMPGCTHFDGEPPAAYVCVPLSAQGEPIGLLHVQFWDEQDATVSADTGPPLVRVIAQHLAVALANLRLKERLFEQATRDKLTGLHNRHYMSEWFDQELHRARRHGRPIGVVMVDLDHFKRINDGFGHDAGDFVLREFAKVLRRHARQSDVACRHGGEEFLLLMPEADLADTRAKAEELRGCVASLGLAYEGRPLGPITVSAGVAVYPRHAETATALLRLADEALYAAKAHGRDRVVVSAVAAAMPFAH